jgi:hypothetical protein
MARLQLRITPTPGGFLWQVVIIEKSELVEVLVVGQHTDLDTTLIQAREGLLDEMAKPIGPVRHEWNCTCGVRLEASARQSRMGMSTWDSPREITCSCGRAYGLKVFCNDGEVRPIIQHYFRQG